MTVHRGQGEDGLRGPGQWPQAEDDWVTMMATLRHGDDVTLNVTRDTDCYLRSVMKQNRIGPVTRNLKS